jgi:S1-C subfamily serine protease
MIAVEPGTPAAEAGIRSGDVLLALDGEAVAGVDDLVRLLNGSRIGQPTRLTLLRSGSVQQVSVVPTERASPQSARAR